MTDEQVLDELIEQLRDEDWQVRYRAADQLKTYREPRAVPHLIEALAREENLTVSFVVAMTLGMMKDTRAIEPLTEALCSNPHHDMQWATSWALLEIGAEAVPNLIQIVGDVEPMTRDIVAELLGRMQNPTALPVLRAAFLEQGLADHATTNRFSAADALERFGGQGRAVFIEALSHDAPEIRARAADALGELGDEGAVEALVPLLSDTAIPFADGERKYRVCDAAADALEHIGNDAAQAALAAWHEEQDR